MKKALSASLAAISIFLTACQADQADNIPTETVQTAENTVISSEAPETEETTAESTVSSNEQTVSETERPMPQFPDDTRMIDIYPAGGEHGDYYKAVQFYFPDDDTMCVLYASAESWDDYENRHSEIGIFDMTSCEEKAHIVLDADFSLFRSSEDENVLFYLTEIPYLWENGDLIPRYATVNKDYSCEITESNDFFAETHYGHKIYHYKSDIIDGDSGQVLVKGVYEGNEHKSNRINSLDFFIDENRFLYSVYGYEWIWNMGIYDYTTGQSYEITVPEFDGYEPFGDLYPFGCSNGKIYSMYGYPESDVYHFICTTDADTLETVKLELKNIPESYSFFDSAGMSEDGSYMLFRYDNGYFTVDSERGELIREFDFGPYYMTPVYCGSSIVFEYDDEIYIVEL